MIKETSEIEILKLLHEEWKYRLSQLWELITKTTTLSLALIFMPLIYEKFGVKAESIKQIKQSLRLITFTGVALSVVVCTFSIVEIRRINSIKTNIKEIARKYSNTNVYSYPNNWVHQNIPYIVLVCQIVIAFLIIMFAK